MFDAISTAGTGLQTYHTWLDSIADNIANVNDVSPTSGTAFQQQYVQTTALQGSNGIGNGVAVTSLSSETGPGVMVQDPSNPLADAQGYVLHSNVDLSQQMGNMIMAQRAFQANASVVTDAKDTYQSAINIGKGMAT
jgi:flagellar basal-body rod protein FlgC